MKTEEPLPTMTTQSPPRVSPGTRRRSNRLTLVILLIAIAGGLYFWLRGPSAPGERAPEAIPSVAVARVTRQDLSEQVPIPAEFRPYVESELHAMVTGYVSKMNVDFGDKVHKGDVLATLEVPELFDQLHNAQATQQQAQADYDNEHLIYTRLLEVNRQHPKLVAQQDIDTARSKDAAAAAAMAAASANVEKYQTLVGYTNIVCPFDGVITKRSADPGDLVQAGTSSDNAQPLVRVSDNYLLRLDFPVSVDYVQDVHPGAPVTVRVDSLGGKLFTGKITRFADQVNDETRTMQTELEVQNPSLELIPGMYAVVLFKFEDHPHTLAIPIEAVSNPKDAVVYVVSPGNEVEARPIKIGLETPDKYEVTGGLREGELVITGNGSTVHPGQKVDPKIIPQPAIP